jgi:hypothetical protein
MPCEAPVMTATFLSVLILVSFKTQRLSPSIDPNAAA